jgi:hypothetical protein
MTFTGKFDSEKYLVATGTKSFVSSYVSSVTGISKELRSHSLQEGKPAAKRRFARHSFKKTTGATSWNPHYSRGGSHIAVDRLLKSIEGVLPEFLELNQEWIDTHIIVENFSSWLSTGQRINPRSQRFVARYDEALARAKTYREEYGDPLSSIVDLLSQIELNDDDWRGIIDEPYG